MVCPLIDVKSRIANKKMIMERSLAIQTMFFSKDGSGNAMKNMQMSVGQSHQIKTMI